MSRPNAATFEWQYTGAYTPYLGLGEALSMPWESMKKYLTPASLRYSSIPGE